jgi:hypothetical protein
MTARLLAAAALLGGLVAGHAHAQQASPPVVTAPQTFDVGAPEEPIRMLTEDAVRFLGRRSDAGEPSPQPPSSGESHTVLLDPPAVVNGTSHFLFRDVTARPTASERTPLPLSERRAAVEAYRQSLAKPRRAAR